MSDQINQIYREGVVTQAMRNANIANSEAETARWQAITATQNAAKSSGNTIDNIRQLRTIGDQQKEIDRLNQALEEKQKVLTEWMHSNEAFKRLARQYGKKLGLSDAQRLADMDEQILDIVEESPEHYEHTDVAKLAQQRKLAK